MQATENRVQTRGFGVFEVDERAAELRKRGIRIKLQEQPLQILCLLLDHSGEVVTREELRHKLWPAHTFVDFDRSLNKAMTKLRSALGDSAENPRYVETIPRHGYRFLAPVHHQRRRSRSSGGHALGSPSKSGGRPRFRSIFLWIAEFAHATRAEAPHCFGCHVCGGHPDCSRLSADSRLRWPHRIFKLREFTAVGCGVGIQEFVR